MPAAPGEESGGEQCGEGARDRDPRGGCCTAQLQEKTRRRQKEEVSTPSPGNPWKPEGTHLAGRARLSRVWIRASPSFLRLCECFSFEVTWNRKKEPLSKAQ